jgi:hypothetical protein
VSQDACPPFPLLRMGQKSSKRESSRVSRQHLELLRRQSGNKSLSSAAVALPDLRERIALLSQEDSDADSGFNLEFILLEKDSAIQASKDGYEEARKLANLSRNRYGRN